MAYKGRFTRAGNSKSYAFESALFRSHPEFDSSNVEAEYIGPGVLLVRAVDAGDGAGPGEDPVLGAFLAFVERDMIEHPDSIQPLSSDLLERAQRLVGDMDVDLNERID
ncbi:MAG TPA: type II toxin-antitoxin system PrlF family antitoxin [Longimicrobium sp.]|jgi:antitoxin PrlF